MTHLSLNYIKLTYICLFHLHCQILHSTTSLSVPFTGGQRTDLLLKLMWLNGSELILVNISSYRATNLLSINIIDNKI